MTKDNDGWGTPTEWVPLKHDDGSVAGGYKKETTFGKRPTPVPAANVMLQTQNAAHGMKAMHDKMIADGFTQTGPDMYEKVHTEELIQQWGGDAIAWGAHPDQTSPMTVTPEQWGEYVERNYNDDGSGNLTAKREPEINVGGTLNFFHDDPPRAEYVEGPDAWPVNPEDAGEDGDNDPDLAYRSTNESMWGDDPNAELDLTDFTPVTDATYGPTDDERARAINACIPMPADTPWVVDVPDGELTLKTDYMPTVTPDTETGFYVAYAQGVLHCILAGPYETAANAKARSLTAWQRFEADPAMAYAFARDGWNPAGVYVAEIPMKARRRGAYGLI